MGDHDGGDAELVLELLDLVAQADAHLGVQGAQRLVQQQQSRRCGQGAGQGDALLLAAGQLGGVLGALVRHADQLQQLVDAGGDVRLGHLAVLQAVGDVLEDREVGEQRVGLEDDAEIPFRRRQVRDIPARLLDAAVGLDVEPRDGAQQRRLAAPRRAEKAHELAFKDLQADILDGREVTELLGDVFDLQVRGPRLSGRGRCIRLHGTPGP